MKDVCELQLIVKIFLEFSAACFVYGVLLMCVVCWYLRAALFDKMGEGNACVTLPVLDEGNARVSLPVLDEGNACGSLQVQDEGNACVSLPFLDEGNVCVSLPVQFCGRALS